MVFESTFFRCQLRVIRLFTLTDHSTWSNSDSLYKPEKVVQIVVQILQEPHFLDCEHFASIAADEDGGGMIKGILDKLREQAHVVYKCPESKLFSILALILQKNHAFIFLMNQNQEYLVKFLNLLYDARLLNIVLKIHGWLLHTDGVIA